MERVVTPLDPELACLVQDVKGIGPCIRHPLVYAVPYFEGLNHYYNEQLARKKEALQRASESLDFRRQIWLYERPYRLAAFRTAMITMPDDLYWPILSEVWIDSENIWEEKSLWQKLFQHKRKQQQLFMTEEERGFLRLLPDQLTIYRGHNSKNQKGFSWTLSEEKAQWFANRFAMRGAGIVSKKKVNKADLFAVLLRREEDEVIYLPKKRPRSPKNLTSP